VNISGGSSKPLRQKHRRAQPPSTNELDEFEQAVGWAHE
jgi:hypothetical protein